MVNLSGISFDHRMTEDTGASVVDVTRAWVAARDILDFAALWAEIDALDRRTSRSTPSSTCSSTAGGWPSGRAVAAAPPPAADRHRRGRRPVPPGLGGAGPVARAGARRADGRRRALGRGVAAHRRRARATSPSGPAMWPLLHTGFDLVELAGAHGMRRRPTSPPSTGRCSTASTCRGCGTASARCRAPTAGRRRPARRCATTC